MHALTLTVVLFSFWTLVGAGVLSVLPRGARAARIPLLAPAVGVALTMLVIAWGNRLGAPVQRLASPVAWGLGVAALLAVAARGRRLPWRRHLVFVPLLAIAMAVVAQPMLAYEYDWISFANDDMTNYVLAAHRFAHHGFSEVPDLQAFVGNTDPTLSYWFMHVIDGARCGAEELLAFTISLTHGSGHQVFMPLITSFYLTLICAAGALLPTRPRRLPRSLVVSIGVACSALTAFGVLYQLIAQVMGLGLLCALVALMAVPRLRPGDAAVATLLTAALVVGYPEIMPFFVLTFAVLVAWGRRLVLLRQGLAVAGVSALVVLPAVLPVIDYMAAQTRHGSSNVDGSQLFPYYLVPSGFADLAGLIPIAARFEEPWMSLAILLGMSVTATGIWAVVACARRRLPCGMMGVVMLGMAAVLFTRSAGFGLYKLAMFVQPFAIACLAATAVASPRRRIWLGLAAVLCVLNLRVEGMYVDKSRGNATVSGGGFVEIPFASSRGMISDLVRMSREVRAPLVVSDTSNIVVNKVECLYFPGRTFFSPTFGLNLTYFSDNAMLRGLPRSLFGRSASLVEAGGRLRDAIAAQVEKASFDFGGGVADPFERLVLDRGGADAVMLEEAAEMGIINRSRKTPGGPFVSVRSLAQVSNHLLFTPSKLGQENYYGKRDAVTLYQMEPDPLVPGGLFAGLGRWFVFEVVHPTRQVRLCLDVSRTLMHDGDNRLPPAAAVGQGRVPLPLRGRGSARVVSAPFVPQIVGGRPYVGLDLGMEGRAFEYPRRGLMRLFGTDVVIDPRRLVGFGRDISLISEEAYAARVPPPAVDLPAGLRAPSLEYAGLYEDGWASEQAFLRLTAAPGTSRVRVTGQVPLIGDPSFTTLLRVSVDGVAAGETTLTLGDFDHAFPVSVTAGPHHVELSFSRWQVLPGDDGRPAVCLLRRVGFER